MLPKVKGDGAVGLSICYFILVYNSNIWPNWAPIQDMRRQNLSIGVTLTLTFKVTAMVSFDSPYMVSY